MKVSFIGFGNMAKAIAQGFQRKSADQLFASSPSLEKGHVLPGGVLAFKSNLDILDDATITILAVKPAQVTEVMEEIGHKLDPETLLLSIAAGVSISTLARFCRPGQAIVRCMPNLPISVQKGATPLSSNPFVSDLQKQQVERLFAQSSLINWGDEQLLNAYTALSGSGPAYVFLFAEALVNAAMELGIAAEDARVFTVQTLSGAVEILKNNEHTPAELRKKVTSPGGTTAAALQVLQQQQFNEIISQALKAACQHAFTLNLTDTKNR